MKYPASRGRISLFGAPGIYLFVPLRPIMRKNESELRVSRIYESGPFAEVSRDGPATARSIPEKAPFSSKNHPD
jgi:hypothetical protein